MGKPEDATSTNPISRERFARGLVATALLLGAGQSVAQADDEGGQEPLSILTKTFTQAQQATPPRAAIELRTLGYHRPGDGGGARYCRVAPDVTDSRLWQLECQGDGSHWQLAEPEVTPLMFGACPDVEDTSDDREAFQAAFDCAATLRRGLWVPPGRYWLSGTVIARPKPAPETPPTSEEYQYQKPGPTYRFDRQAMLRAMEGFKGEAMIAFGDPEAEGEASWETIHRNSTVFGGVFDCNGQANVGLWLTFCNDFRVYDAEVRNFRVHGFRAGSPKAAQRSYGAIFTGCKTTRSLVAASPGSCAIYFRQCGDSHAFNCMLCGAEVGVGGDDVWDGKFTNVHIWNATPHGDLRYGFDVDGDNVLCGCQVDGPFQYAYRFKNLRNSLDSCNANYETTYGGKQDFATVIRIEPGGGVTAHNCNWKAWSADLDVPVAELKAEVEGDTSNFRTKGNKFRGVARHEVSRGPEEICLAALIPGASVDGPVQLGARPVVNVGAVERIGQGVYECSANNTLPATGPLVVTVSPASPDQPLMAVEDASARGEFKVRVIVYDLTGSRQDPQALSVVMYGAG